jgi:hypothetical protein
LQRRQAQGEEAQNEIFAAQEVVAGGIGALETPVGQPGECRAFRRRVACVENTSRSLGQRVGKHLPFRRQTDGDGAFVGINRVQFRAELMQRTLDGEGKARFAGGNVTRGHGAGFRWLGGLGQRQVGLQCKERFEARPFQSQECRGLIGGQPARRRLKKRMVRGRQPGRDRL